MSDWEQQTDLDGAATYSEKADASAKNNRIEERRGSHQRRRQLEKGEGERYMGASGAVNWWRQEFQQCKV